MSGAGGTGRGLVVEARGLYKTYAAEEAPVRAVDGVDIEVEPGETVSVMGPSGCGKSTLLHLLGGLEHPDGGEILLDGRRVDRLSETAWSILRRRTVGFVFQSFNLVDELTAVENVELPALLVGASARRARRRAVELLERLDVAGRADHLPDRLSGGERQRVALARALVNDPLLILADEPTEQSVLVDVYASDTSSFFILVLAVIGISGEWRHRTITSSLLAAPDRLRFLTAKALAFVAAGVTLSLLIAISVATVGTTILSIRGLPLPDAAALVEQVVRNLAVAAALAALGVAFGALLRNQIAAVVALLVVMFVVEPLVVALAPGVGRFAPLGVLPIAAAGLPPDDAGLENVHMLGATTATLALVAWIVAILGVAAALLVRRDLE